MKRTCTIMSLFIMVFLLGNIMVKAQPAEVWNITPDWNVGKDKRGIAYNVLTNHVYVAGTAGGATEAGDAALNQIHVLNAADGSLVKTLTLEPLTPAANGYGIRDVAVSNDGGILATIVTTNNFNPQKLYYWENEDADPVLLWEDKSGNDIDFGPGFDVYGNMKKDACIIIPFFEEASVYYFEVTDGSIADPVTLALTDVDAGRNATVQVLGTKISDGFWYNNTTLNQPTLIDGTGNVTGSIPAGVFSGQTHDVEQFSVGDMTYLAVGEDSVVQIIDITGKAADLSDVTSADSVTEITGKPAIAAGWPPEYGTGHELQAMGLPDGSYVIYSLSGDNYIKANATEGAPFATNVMLSGFAMVDSTVEISYQYVDINGDPEGSSEIKWFLSDDDAGTNKTEITGNQNNLTYTVTSDDVGKYLSYSILAIASSGTASDDSHLFESGFIGPLAPGDARYPVASDLAITGPIAVDEVLQGSYTYFDENGDLEGESIIKWYTADDASGTNMAEVADGTLEYRVKPADDDKFIMFSVTPVAETGVLLEGDEVSVVSDSAVFFPELLPTASDVTITGREEVAGILTGTYTYTDLNGDPEGNTLMKWYSADAIDGAKTELAADTNRYELVTADEGKYVFFGVTPVTEGGEVGEEVFDTTGIIAVEPEPEAPVATDVMVHGTPEAGAVIYGTYTYTDRTDDPEGNSVIKWYTADDADGTNMAQIDGADKYTLIIDENMIGKHLIFEITPVATTGELLEGDPVTAATEVAATASTNDGDFDREWIRAKKLDGTPEYIGTGSTERGFAVGADHIYIASRFGGTKLLVVDKANGGLVGEMNTEGMDVGLFKISDVEVSDDGQILACPLQINASAEPFVVYKWENELSAPTKFIEFTATESMRLGDKFTVVGDVSSDAVIYAAAAAGNKVVRWVVTGGIVDAGTVITLENTTSIGSTPAVAPFDATATSDFIIDGRGFQAQIFDHEGLYVGAIEGVGQSNNQSNSPNIFYFKDRTLVAFHQKNEAGQWNVIVKDITSTPHIEVGTSEVLSTANQELGGVHVQTTEDNFHLFMLSANEGLAQWTGTLELPMFEYAETNLEGTEIYVRFSKNMPDSIGNATGWTIMADTENIGIDTIYGTGTDANILTFALEEPVTEGQAVTIAYDGTGSVTAFDGMPLNPFLDEAVVNVVGAEAPVASDVTIAGETRVGETLTGSYTYSDANGDLEEGSEYQWYYASDAEGSDMLKLLGENDITYTVTEDVAGKYVAFEVIPATTTGGEDFLVGEPAMSDWVFIIGVGMDNEFANTVMIYPNPVADVLTIDNCSDVRTVTLIDLSGKVMTSVDNNGQSSMNINMASYQKGMYIIKLTGENGNTKIERVVKTK